LEVNNEELYKNIGDCLKQNYPNTEAWFITSDLEAHKKIGLRPSRKIQLFNGKLECKFYKFDLYEGSRKQS
jgi:putative N6-adenine-specific DNA methylase